MRTYEEIITDLQKASTKLSTYSPQTWDKDVDEYNIIMKELTKFYSVHCCKCLKKYSECKCKNSLYK